MRTLNREKIKEEMGYEVRTTFFEDFSIAEEYGESAIEDTYKRAFEEWKTNVEYITELCMILNWKCWDTYNYDKKLAEVYCKLFYKAQDWCLNNLKGKDLEYFINTTN